jgi:hypothetical protein
MPPEFWIDMTGAPGWSPQTATGFPRNAEWFWKELLRRHPKLFSPANVKFIREGRAPEVDDVWCKYHPWHVMYVGDTLVHHHIEQAYWAAGIPKNFHSVVHRELHSGTYGP